MIVAVFHDSGNSLFIQISLKIVRRYLSEFCGRCFRNSWWISSGLTAVLSDVLIASYSSAGIKGWLYFSELLDLKLSFCFSVLFLKVRKCGLESLMEEFAENISANVSAVSFLLVASVLFFVRCSRAVGWLFLDIFLIIIQIVFVLVERSSWLT